MKPMRQVEPLETIWEIPDDLWEKVEPVILEGTPPKPPRSGLVQPLLCSKNLFTISEI